MQLNAEGAVEAAQTIADRVYDDLGLDDFEALILREELSGEQPSLLDYLNQSILSLSA